MVKTGQIVKDIGRGAFDDSAWRGRTLGRETAANKVYSVGMTLLRGGLVVAVVMAVMYILMCLTGSMMNIYAAPGIWEVGQSMFSGIYDSIKGIAAWAAVAGAVFCLLGIFFQRDEKAVAGKIKGLVIIGLAYVGIFVLPNIIQTIMDLMTSAGVSDVTGIE